MTKPPDLMGQIFEYLKVIDHAPPDKWGRSRWLCECKCGQQVPAYGSRLLNGEMVSCGCKRERDLKGQHIGMLTVLERSDRCSARGKRKNRLWKCRCDCGAITYKPTDALTSSDLSMCPDCAKKYCSSKAREGAGFVSGTQISKIKNVSGDSKGATGVRGVWYNSKKGLYIARIKFQGKNHYLGAFKFLEDAMKARKKGEEKYYGTFLAQLEAQPTGDKAECPTKNCKGEEDK